MPACVIPECGAPLTSAPPLPLCDRHLAVAADWAARDAGVTDLLPSPCRLCGSPLGVHWPSGWVCAVCEWRYGELPDGDLAPPRVDVVYYLRHGERMKIGTTANPRQRFAAIWHDEVVAFERGDRALEHRRHEQFAADRFPGSEWFRLSDALAAHVERVRVADPWRLHARWIAEAVARRG